MDSASHTPKSKRAEALRLIGQALLLLADDESKSAEWAAWVSQACSPLGKRRHTAACRRRIELGEGGARIVGRRHDLSPEALQDELNKISQRATPRKVQTEEPTTSIADELASELRLAGARRR